MEARALLASFVLTALVAQAFVGVVESRTSPMEEKASQGDDVKKPDCVPGVDPHMFPGVGGHGGGITPVPSHGGGITPVPSHGGSSGTSPSHGGSSGPALPSPSHGGAGSSPSTGGGYGGSPSHGGSGSSPSTGGGGAYGSSPSTPGGAYGSGGSASPSQGGGAYGGSSPTPAYGDSPSHGGIGTSSPTPFVAVDPHSLGSLPGSCDYWRSHPMEIWSAIGGRFPSSMRHLFGSAAGGVGGADVSIQDALANTRSDGAGALLREGAAALLNSMTRAGFLYTTEQVRDAFAAAAAGGSDGAAAAQAAAFKKANEGKA
ncbi:protodermal factor 1-like [Panicum virgatum]|uniref:Meiosis 5 n=1 Tax=Panicum virgatum TaxID=38727 RepID=A0A8T0RNX1_PANVG|nr:protodermal factor 1-like [Panicum virgatum]KAG2586323.1 hypothetical protein PVAP13_5NG045100 [Panicum virgatum]